MHFMAAGSVIDNLIIVRQNLGKTLDAVETIKDSLVATAEQVQVS